MTTQTRRLPYRRREDLDELAILAVAAHRQAEFEWWAHARLAREHGIDESAIASIAAGDTPNLNGNEQPRAELGGRPV